MSSEGLRKALQHIVAAQNLLDSGTQHSDINIRQAHYKGAVLMLESAILLYLKVTDSSANKDKESINSHRRLDDLVINNKANEEFLAFYKRPGSAIQQIIHWSEALLALPLSSQGGLSGAFFESDEKPLKAAPGLISSDKLVTTAAMTRISAEQLRAAAEQCSEFIYSQIDIYGEY